MNKPTTYIETHNKAQLMNAVMAVPYLPGETAVIVAKHSQGETRFTFTPGWQERRNGFTHRLEMVNNQTEEEFNARLRNFRRNIKRTPAHVWQ